MWIQSSDPDPELTELILAQLNPDPIRNTNFTAVDEMQVPEAKSSAALTVKVNSATVLSLMWI